MTSNSSPFKNKYRLLLGFPHNILLLHVPQRYTFLSNSSSDPSNSRASSEYNNCGNFCSAGSAVHRRHPNSLSSHIMPHPYSQQTTMVTSHFHIHFIPLTHTTIHSHKSTASIIDSTTFRNLSCTLEGSQLSHELYHMSFLIP